MKIALVFDGLQFGGIERVGADYAKLLKTAGHDITVINLIPQRMEMEREFPEGCRFLHVNYPRYFAPERFAAMLNKWPVWGRYLYPAAYLAMGAFGAIYRPFLKCRHRVLRERFDAAIAFSGHVNDLTFVSGGYVKGMRRAAWLHGAQCSYGVASPGFFHLYRKIKNLVCLSEQWDEVCEKFNKENRIYKEKIYNPVFMMERPLDHEKIAALKEQYGDFAVMVARLADDKDQKTAIRAIRVLRDKYQVNKNLLLVGDGKNRSMLQAYAAEQGVAEQIVFVGSVYDVQNYYTAADMLVHSSPMEGLPTVLIEAMYFGIPIAATDSIPGVRELLGNDTYGLISPVYDAEALAENINRLCRNTELRENLVAKAKVRFEDFRPETIRVQLERFLEKICSEKMR